MGVAEWSNAADSEEAEPQVCHESAVGLVPTQVRI